MILLDTNVLSAVMLDVPDVAVVEWLDTQPAESIWTTSVTVFEIHMGIELLTPSRRRRRLVDMFAQLLAEDLDGRVQFFDVAAALAAGAIAAETQRTGRSVDFRDVQIAGIAASRRATVATRNVRHFEGAGVDLVNPWESQ
jgi:predicted nucleic acid-binding protein